MDTNQTNQMHSVQVEERLSRGEETVLGKAELTIAKGIQIFWEVGAALATIRDQRLYRGTYDSFEAYTLKRWGMGRSYACRLIGAAGAMANLSEAVVEVLPMSERQVRPLLALPPEGQRVAWGLVLDQIGGANQAKKVTAAMVDEAVQAVTRLSAGAAESAAGPAAAEAVATVVAMDDKPEVEPAKEARLAPVVVPEPWEWPTDSSIMMQMELDLLARSWPVVGRVIDPVARAVFCCEHNGRVVKTIGPEGYEWLDIESADNELELDACIFRLDWRPPCGTSLTYLTGLLLQAQQALVNLAVFVDPETMADSDLRDGLPIGLYRDNLAQIVHCLGVESNSEGTWLVFDWAFSWKRISGGLYSCPWSVWP